VVFTSTVFVFAFLPLALATFYCVPARWRTAPLLLCSCLFYGWGEPVQVILILASSLVNYIVGRRLSRTAGRQARALLLSGIALNLAPLLFFKYTKFVLEAVGLHATADRVRLPLPIGVSFYTFMAISYLLDIYRGRNSGTPSLRTFAAYLTMFPHLVAGPVVRWRDVGPQLLNPKFVPGLFGYGALRASVGLAKKTVLADSISPIVDRMFATGAPTSVGSAWVAALLYSLQIYLDFSAYSDIAIGLAAMLGVRFEENFRYPYQSRSAREFWQRWHITLGSWFRDYIYIPLGGSRVSTPKLWRNLMVVWALTGLWHGAAWTFVLWGVYYGVLIGLERGALGKALEKLPRRLTHVYGLVVVVFGWVIFRAHDVNQVREYFRTMVGLAAKPGWDSATGFTVAQDWILILLAVLVSAGIAGKAMSWFERQLTGASLRRLPQSSIPKQGGMSDVATGVAAISAEAPDATSESSVALTAATLLVDNAERLTDSQEGLRGTPGLTAPVLATIATAVLLFISTAFMVAVTYSPFIYFRF